VSIFTRGAAGEGLSEYESAQYQLMTMAELRYHENVHYQYRNGLYDEDEYRAHRAQWSTFVFRQKGRVAVFCEARVGFSPEFVAEIEGLLTTYKC
jgi:hypothetical protein